MAGVDDGRGGNRSEDRHHATLAEQEMNDRLPFEEGDPIEARRISMPTHTVTSRARCSGCSTTALLTSTRRGKWPELPAGWCACGETADGELALWCSQCTYERRFDSVERGTGHMTRADDASLTTRVR